MTEPISNAPGTVARTGDDRTDDAIARMLDKPEQVLEIIKQVAALDAVRTPDGHIYLCHDMINVLYVREQARRVLGRG